MHPRYLAKFGLLAIVTMASTAATGAPPPAKQALPVHIIALPAGGAVIAKPDQFHLHLPGISGRMYVDQQLTLGLRDAGYAGSLQIYDWTGDDPGITALLAYKRNQLEAQKVADYIVAQLQDNPKLHITMSGHSGGTGILIWALEKLPANVFVDNIVLLASALSPDYDLSAALRHVRGTCYNFCSENDVLVLGAGTKMFATIDGKKTEAAGYFGFIFPAGGDLNQYDKMIQKAYDKSWMQYRNLGDHMGCMQRPFSEKFVAPLIMNASSNRPPKAR